MEHEEEGGSTDSPLPFLVLVQYGQAELSRHLRLSLIDEGVEAREEAGEVEGGMEGEDAGELELGRE